jgi:hypothetical protein
MIAPLVFALRNRNKTENSGIRLSYFFSQFHARDQLLFRHLLVLVVPGLIISLALWMFESTKEFSTAIGVLVVFLTPSAVMYHLFRNIIDLGWAGVPISIASTVSVSARVVCLLSILLALTSVVYFILHITNASDLLLSLLVSFVLGVIGLLPEASRFLSRHQALTAYIVRHMVLFAFIISSSGPLTQGNALSSFVLINTASFMLFVGLIVANSVGDLISICFSRHYFHRFVQSSTAWEPVRVLIADLVVALLCITVAALIFSCFVSLSRGFLALFSDFLTVASRETAEFLLPGLFSGAVGVLDFFVKMFSCLTINQMLGVGQRLNGCAYFGGADFQRDMIFIFPLLIAFSTSAFPTLLNALVISFAVVLKILVRIFRRPAEALHASLLEIHQFESTVGSIALILIWAIWMVYLAFVGAKM